MIFFEKMKSLITVYLITSISSFIILASTGIFPDFEFLHPVALMLAGVFTLGHAFRQGSINVTATHATIILCLYLSLDFNDMYSSRLAAVSASVSGLLLLVIFLYQSAEAAKSGQVKDNDNLVSRLFNQNSEKRDTMRPASAPVSGDWIAVKSLNKNVWQSGFYKESNNGTNFKMTVSSKVKRRYPRKKSIDRKIESWNFLYWFKELDLRSYEDRGELRFLVLKGERVFTLPMMTDRISKHL